MIKINKNNEDGNTNFVISFKTEPVKRNTKQIINNVSLRFTALKLSLKAVWRGPKSARLVEHEDFSTVLLSFEEKKPNPNRALVVSKGTAIVGTLAFLFLVASAFSLFSGNFFNVTHADEPMCTTDVDVVMLMDVSGSMGDGEAPSQCNWWIIEDTGGGIFGWVFHSDNGVTEDWCDSKDQPSKPSQFTATSTSKITASKEAANSFVDNLGLNDQSAVVSFSGTANLDKSLSNDHSATKSAIDGLVIGGATNIGDAILASVNELGSTRGNPQSTKSIVLLTDGKATCPYKGGSIDPECGFAEDQGDIDHALAQAQVAAGLGYRIFVIGLGDTADINETMLQAIADMTGGKYFHSSNGSGLSDIYTQISEDVCDYGSISGRKFTDLTGDGLTQDDEILVGFEIMLTGSATTSQLTDANGQYVFAGLLPGNYTVSEGANASMMPFTQTHPVNPLSISSVRP
ncbi:VWA domain-containing protein, partial [Patescibacteria group bacterium]